MTLRALLVGPTGHGGEGVYVGALRDHPPAEVRYELAAGFHHGAPGASCQYAREIALNRLVHPLAIPDMGFRALRLRERFDLVHVHAHPVHLAARGDVPLVMSEGSSAAVYLGEYLGWDDARVRSGLRRARGLYRLLGIDDRLLALARVARAYVFSHWARAVNLRWGADPARLEVLAPGFATPPAVERAGRDGFEFLFVGADFERKGGFEVVEAFERVARERPEVSLTIAGSDPGRRNPDRLVHSWVSPARRERGLARLEELCGAGRARVLPWLDRDALRARLFPAADAFVMPSHAEGFGFTNVEALSFGLPVLTSTVGPAAEIVAHERTGLLVAPGDADALAHAMLRLAGDPEAARRMGDAGRADFLERFTLERLRAGLGDIYRRALAG